MAGTRAPKQWSLSKVETITSFEAWRQNLQYTLSLDQNFAAFLVDGFTWLKKTNANPLRGIVDDGEAVAEANRRTAAQKCTHLDLMLGQIANYCPIISRNTIIKNSTSINSIWQSIRLHYGFQSTGGHFLDFNSIFLEPDERPEDLFQRLASFIEDNMLRAGGNIHHHGEVPEADEELSPSLEKPDCPSKLRGVSALRRVSTKQSPFFKPFYTHFPLELTLDTGAEVSMIKASSADYIGVTIKKSNPSALQADGVTPLNIVGECHFTLSRITVRGPNSERLRR
ncbi:unnamed protein product [Mytilus edulis]|uniref:Uncharacterized protein n=1 Tax=Mytilus edulis TaxID=6550 RepID=A0A8S3R0R8_MYTED|nr:unnamed protein product [Mytilus edulis]